MTFSDGDICTVDYDTGRITEIGGKPWPPKERRLKPVPNAAKWWRMYSVQCFAAIVALQGAWAASPAIQALLSPAWVQGITLALAVAGAVLRLIDQPKAR